MTLDIRDYLTDKNAWFVNPKIGAERMSEPVTTDALTRAINEAKRFLERAEASDCDRSNSIKRSACKRSSMDLTRALSDLRRHDSYEWEMGT